MPRKSKGKSNSVNFRLDADSYADLCLRAEHFGLSHNLYAKECLLSLLHEQVERADLGRRVAALEKAVFEQRQDLALSVEALLIASGNYDEAEAHSWVQSQFNIP